MKEMSMRMPLYGALALLATLTGCMGDDENFSVNSVNQPVVTAAGASVPNCPNFKSQGKDSAALTDTNYGCAMNSNFAAMIADPADLLRGRTDPGTGHDALAAVKAVKAYRETAPSGKDGLTKVSAKGGGQ